MNDRTQDDAPPIIRMEGVGKWFGKFQVLAGIDLQVAAGERVGTIISTPRDPGATE